MLVRDFSDRAEECVRLAQHTKSPHDRELFIEMARAWYGLTNDVAAAASQPKAPATGS
jgi:hypothetical protein